jgi:hypothetical protein
MENQTPAVEVPKPAYEVVADLQPNETSLLGLLIEERNKAVTELQGTEAWASATRKEQVLMAYLSGLIQKSGFSVQEYGVSPDLKNIIRIKQ